MRLVSNSKIAIAAGAAIAFCFSWAADIRAQTGPEWDIQRLVWRCGAEAREEGLTGDAEGEFTQKCIDENSKPRRRQQAQRNNAAQTQDGMWTYGVHPVLGLSAHVSSGGHAVGLACGYSGAERWRSDPISYRITPNLLPNATKPGGAIIFFDGPSIGGGGTMFDARPGGYLESKQDGCQTDIRGFKRSKALLFVHGTFQGVAQRGRGHVTTLRQNGITKEVFAARDFAKLVDVTRIPLAGATSAIDQLMRACPAMKHSVEFGCDH